MRGGAHAATRADLFTHAFPCFGSKLRSSAPASMLLVLFFIELMSAADSTYVALESSELFYPSDGFEKRKIRLAS